MNTIVTVVIGEAEKWFRYTGPYMAEYAANIGAALRVVRESPYANIHPVWARWEIGNAFNDYDRVIYIDADAYVFPDCPSLFDLVPEKCVGMYAHNHYVKHQEFIREVKACADVFGVYYGWLPDIYLNAGIMVLSRHHRKLFEESPQILVEVHRAIAEKGAQWMDQTLLNYKIANLGYPIHQLDYRFNHRNEDTPSWGRDRFDSYIMHYDKQLIAIDAPRISKEADRRRREMDIQRRRL